MCTWNILFSNLSPSLRVSSVAALVDSLAIATAIWDNKHCYLISWQTINMPLLLILPSPLQMINLRESGNMVSRLDRLLNEALNREDFGNESI